MNLFNIIFSLCLIIYNCKNIFLPFKKILFEKFTGQKSIDEYINYDIYIDLLVGTPPQKVTHFIDPNDSVFQFKKKSLQYNIDKFNSSIISKIEQEEFHLFNSDKSSSLKGYYSDNFTFNIYNTNKTLEVENLKFTIYLNNRMGTEKYGIIGLYKMLPPSSFFGDLYSFLNQLKTRNFIDDYIFTFIYENIDDNYFSINKTILGMIIIGEYTYIFDAKNFKKEEEIKVYSSSNSFWCLMFDEIKFKYNNENYIENHIEANIDFFSKFIKGTDKYKEKIEILFFKDLINENICKKEIIFENKYVNKYEIYSCNNTNVIREKIKQFPELYLTIKSDNLKFIFTYKDLFKLFDNKLYFLIIFPFLTSKNWYIGEIFLNKYICTFNSESKSIYFYKNQIDKLNNIKQEKDNKKYTNNLLRYLIEIFMGLIIIFLAFIIYRKYRKSRKLLANELEDNNYAYITNEKGKENKKQKIME